MESKHLKKDLDLVNSLMEDILFIDDAALKFSNDTDKKQEAIQTFKNLHKRSNLVQEQLI